MSSHMLTGASIGTISHSTFVVNAHSEKSARDRLSAAAAHSALHDAPARTDETRCHRHTRTNVLDHLERWAQGICDEGAPIFWLHGGAGAGKSAIMQTLAECCVAQKLALGCFFFSRSDPTRNTAQVLIPTLVYQLIQLCPEALQVLNPIFNHDPLVFNKSLRVQLLDLLVRPLRRLVQLGIISDAPNSPRVFLIDGLDECSDPAQQKAIIQAVRVVCYEHRIPVKFLIASRPEQAISLSFEWHKQGNSVLGAISLSDDPDAEDDIRRFLEDEFLKIGFQHPFRKMIPSEWPGFYRIKSLVRKSSSHFIYASTAMKYIWSAQEDPVRSLQVVLGLEVSRTKSPFSELDALYHHILAFAAHRDKVLQVLGYCLFLDNLPRTLGAICDTLECSPNDFLIYMADMIPLVTFPQSASDLQGKVTLHHASLGDFLSNQSRSGLLYIDPVAYGASKLGICFQLLDCRSRELRTIPHWQDNFPLGNNRGFRALRDQVNEIIHDTGHLVKTQEVLKRYSLLDYYELQLRCRGETIGIILIYLFNLFVQVHGIKTPEGAALFRSSTEDFLDILHSHISLQSMPLVGATFTLVFLEYPDKDSVFHILKPYFESRDSTISRLYSVFNDIPPARLFSICNSVNNRPERLAVATEAMLTYLFNDEIGSLTPSRNIWKNTTTLTGSAIMTFDGMLLETLLWALPRAGILEEIAIYSGRTLPRGGYESCDVRVSLVEKYLDEYNTRMKDAKLAELAQRIENGDVSALIERSGGFNINAQD
ncbi:hypothetical protein D9619_012183 [Psilocybe cf. subviscida]|uniref:Nephrocystin 3-like N-terminal domain-containing protein n=1 Tax=Psilocybe cf. subviscida TaxID=2480587 RepID=A0A8H5EZ75_9AGAR|nr:hypothetical protein D9619_012183 [Psilocybe cf. subviscida]